MTLVYNPEEPHVCEPPRHSPLTWNLGAIWKCECGNLFRLHFPSSGLSYAVWTEIYRCWEPITYWRYRNK